MDIANAVQQSLKSIQTRSGRTWRELSADECPIGSLDGFDSYAAVEATSELERVLGRELKLDMAFADGTTRLTLRQACERVEAALRVTR